jgi:hypothetical protein
VKTAGLASRNSLLSIARAWNVWVPRPTFEYVAGLAHEVKLPESRRHSKRAIVPLSVPVKRKVIVLDVVVPPLAVDLPRPSIAAVIAVSGGLSSRSRTLSRPSYEGMTLKNKK